MSYFVKYCYYAHIFKSKTSLCSISSLCSHEGKTPYKVRLVRIILGYVNQTAEAFNYKKKLPNITSGCIKTGQNL